jgi:NTP pyrophosphatase (non-canonical NTP hydrolase)
MNTPGHINDQPIKDFETPNNGYTFTTRDLTLNEYQLEAAKNKAFPEKYAIIYPTIGVLNEAGEMAGKIKKWMRGDTPNLNVEDLTGEIGDVL